MMNLKALLLLVFVAVVAQAKGPKYVVPLKIRGGGQIGPVDADMAINLAKVATSAYVGASATKFISNKTGATSPKVRYCMTCLLHEFAQDVFASLTLVLLANDFIP